MKTLFIDRATVFQMTQHETLASILTTLFPLGPTANNLESNHEVLTGVKLSLLLNRCKC